MKPLNRLIRNLIIVIAVINLNLWLTPNIQAKDETLAQLFVLLNSTSSSYQAYAQVQTLIESGGGHITHHFPNQAVIATAPSSMIQPLAQITGVAGVFTQPVELSTIDIYGLDARSLVSMWNSLITPPPAASNMSVLEGGHDDDHNDAFAAPDLPSENNFGVASNSSITPGYYQTSQYMAGSVAVGIVLLESNGNTDPSTENWTTDEKQLVFNEIVSGLNWWAALEPRANLSFVYDDHFSTPLSTGVEPITRPYYHQQYWIGDAMQQLGYSSASYFSQVRDYNNDLRDTYQTDWAFTIFVVDSSADSDNRFSDGYFAYAYLGGPFLVMTSGNNGYGPYNMDAVAAHEVGHIFHALDQYYSAYQPCNRRSGYLYIENQNSQYGGCASNTTSIMRGQIYPFSAKAIDTYAAGQIGWRDSDSDNIFDPLDTQLPVTISNFSQNGNSINASGSANIVPYPSPSYNSVTINTLTNIKYRIDGASWQTAIASDGQFDATTESYSISAEVTAPGAHMLEVAAFDSAGNISDVFASQTFNILDPVDGGLNTEIFLPGGNLHANAGATINGIAYHMQGGIVTNVEYRIDGGGWLAAQAQDGAFDSATENFFITLDDDLQPGSYTIDARATDNLGNVEVNFASQTVNVAQSSASTTFLPIIIQ